MPEYPLASPPAPGRPVEVAPGVRWLRMPLPFALDHINLWLLEDGEGWAVVDTGVDRAEVRALWEGLFADGLEGRPIRRVIVTHYHPDHVGLAGWLARRWQAPLAMAAEEAAVARAQLAMSSEEFSDALCAFYRQHGLDQAGERALREYGNNYATLVGPLPERIERLREGDGLTIEGRTWRVIVGRGHTPEHVCLYCPELDVLISGDQVLPRITTNISVHVHLPDANPLAEYLASFRSLRELPRSVLVLPSHGLIFRGLHARIEALEAHHEERLAELRAACAEPRTAASLLSVLFRRELADAHSLFFAMGECIAHLNFLLERGAVRRAEQDGVYRFQVA